MLKAIHNHLVQELPGGEIMSIYIDQDRGRPCYVLAFRGATYEAETRHPDWQALQYTAKEKGVEVGPLTMPMVLHNCRLAGVARQTGIPYRTIQDWASGRRTPPEYLTRLMEYWLHGIRNEGTRMVE